MDDYTKNLEESNISMDDYLAGLIEKWRPGGEVELALRATYEKEETGAE